MGKNSMEAFYNLLIRRETVQVDVEIYKRVVTDAFRQIHSLRLDKRIPSLVLAELAQSISRGWADAEKQICPYNSKPEVPKVYDHDKYQAEPKKFEWPELEIHNIYNAREHMARLEIAMGKHLVYHRKQLFDAAGVGQACCICDNVPTHKVNERWFCDDPICNKEAGKRVFKRSRVEREGTAASERDDKEQEAEKHDGTGW